MKFLFAILLFGALEARAIGLDSIKREKWNNLDVVWIEDNSTLTFSVRVYFADGALSDMPNRRGETDYMFTGLFWGTNRFNQQEISNNLEYFGIESSFNVFHEYSTLSFYGLNKDIIPVTKKYCHLFSDSIYPKNEVTKYTKRVKSHLGNLVTDHSNLADHVFRRLSLRGTPFEFPVEGTLQTVGRIKATHLKRKRDYINHQVKKKLYLRGNRDILKIKDIILGECGWGKPSETFVRTVEKRPKYKHKKIKTKIVLIPVNDANQAQIRVGRFLAPQDIADPELLKLMSEYLGGNFISTLNSELRSKRGLVYAVHAFAVGQKYYGRSAITTFSRNEKMGETIKVIRDIIGEMGNGKIDTARLKRTVNYLQGRHLFQFESYDSFLRRLMFFDHIERNWQDIYRYPQIIGRLSTSDVAASASNIFNWDDILVVVVGNRSLLRELRKIDSTQVLGHQNYL